MSNYIFRNGGVFTKTHKFEDLNGSLTDTQKLFLRFLKEEGVYGLIMNMHGSLTRLRFTIGHVAKDYANIFNASSLLYLRQKWFSFAKDIIAKEEEETRKRHEAMYTDLAKLLSMGCYGLSSAQYLDSRWDTIDDYNTYKSYDIYRNNIWYQMPKFDEDILNR